jgi:hypothetical protein
MKRSLICVHCGAAMSLEPRPDPVTMRLHLSNVHCEIAAFGQALRWADLLEHFFVLPLQTSSLPPLCTPDASKPDRHAGRTQTMRSSQR